MSEWKEYKLGKVCLKIGSGATPRGGGDTYLDEGEYALIRSQNVLDFIFSYDGLAYISGDQAEKLNNVALEEQDILLNITGDSVARVCQVPKTLLPARVNQHVAIIRPVKSILLPEFLKYYFLNPVFKSYLLTLSSSGATRNALTKGMIENLAINAPSLTTQKTIAEILSSLDNKIELNNQINKNLEDLAQALFKQWFIDFEFPNENGNPYKSSGGEMVESELGEIPKGWRVTPLERIVDIIDPHPSHRAPTEVPIGFPFAGIGDIDEYGNINSNKARVVSEETVLAQKASYQISNYSVGYGRVGTVGKVVRLRPRNYQYSLSPTLAVINPKEEVLGELTFYLLKSDNFYRHMLQFESGTTRPTLGILAFRKISIPFPNMSNKVQILEAFHNATKDEFKIIDLNNCENQELICLRNLLLPLLISGKLQVTAPTLEAAN